MSPRDVCPRYQSACLNDNQRGVKAADLIRRNNDWVHFFDDPNGRPLIGTALDQKLAGLPFVAQTAVSSSYGLMQLMYPTAVKVLAFYQQPPPNPHELFDVERNIWIGVQHLRDWVVHVDMRANTGVWHSPKFQSWQQWEDLWKAALLRYNGGGRPAYPREVLGRVKNYLPRRAVNSQVFQ